MGLNYHPSARDWVKLVGEGIEHVQLPTYYVPAGKQLVLTAFGMTLQSIGPHHSMGPEQLCIPGSLLVRAYGGTIDNALYGTILVDLRLGYSGQAEAAVLNANGQLVANVRSMFQLPPGLVYHAGTRLVITTPFDDEESEFGSWWTGYARAYGYLAPDTA